MNQNCTCKAGPHAIPECHATSCAHHRPPEEMLQAFKEVSRSQHPGHTPAEDVLKLKPETIRAMVTDPTCYLSGRYKEAIAGREPVPTGAEVSFVNFNWPDQIDLYTKEALVAASVPGGHAVVISIDALKKIHRELDACQRVIHLAGTGNRGYGFDPAYVEGAQAQLEVIDEIINMARKP